MNDQRSRSDGPLRPVTMVFIELPLLIVYSAGKRVRVMAEIERSDNAIIGSWLRVRGDALADQKNLFREVLDIVAVFHHRYISDVTQQGRL